MPLFSMASARWRERSASHRYQRSTPRPWLSPLRNTRIIQIRRARIKRDGSFVSRLTTEYTETPLATRIWLEKIRPRRKSAHFNTVYKRSEGWLSRAEGLISSTPFRVRMAVSVPSVVQNAVLYNGAANASGLPNIGISVRPFFQCLELQTRGHTLGEQNHCARIKRGDTVSPRITSRPPNGRSACCLHDE